jgi:hypothetical protein
VFNLDLTILYWTFHLTNLDILYWIITGLALIGVVLNIKKDKKCFYIWSATNALFAFETFVYGAWNMTILFSIYFILAIVGIMQWSE